MLQSGPLDPMAISPLHPTLPVFGRGLRIYGDGNRQAGHANAQDQAASDRATDSTGLSFSQEDIRTALEAAAREQAERAPEMAYLAAGSRVVRTPSFFDNPENAALSSVAGSLSGAMAQTAPSTAEAAPARNVVASQSQNRPDTEDAEKQTGGTEARSAERAFMGAGSSSEKPKDSSTSDAQHNLTEEEKAEVNDLKARDREVRTHEQAHLSASGGLAMGGASFQQERGPDGRMYAVGGEVQIDTSEGATAEESITKAQRIRRAALAPAQPSAQDRQVAAQAARMEAEARQEKTSGEEGSSGEASGTGRLSMRMEQARTAYTRAAGSSALAPWGTGISYAV